MFVFANSRHRRSLAAFVLLGWVFALFVSIVHSCLANENSHYGVPTLSALHADGSAHHADSPGAAHDDLCQAACDAQTSPAIKEKSSDPSHADRLVVLVPSSAYLLVDAPRALVIPHPAHNAAHLYAHAVFLRATRLTI